MKKTILAIVILAGIGAILAWAFLEGRKEHLMGQEGERPIKVPSRVIIQDGKSIIHIDKETQIKSGFALESLAPVVHQKEIKAYGTVLQLQELFDLRNQYIEAKAHLKKIRVSLTTTSREYERLRALNEDNKNASDKALQAAEAAWRSDAAESRVALETIRILRVKTRQQWGDILTLWLFRGSPLLNRMIQCQDVLIQITLPPDADISLPPGTARIQVSDRTFVTARLVSPSPRTDPRIQGASFFYLVSTKTTAILPGMNILAYLPVGPQVQGGVVPSSAVVWWQGKAWVYAQMDPENFVRREIPTESPVEDGWFVTKGFTPGDQLLMSGAQLLLSEEFRAQIQVGEEGISQ
ncbi:MAG: efflux RND transporter periplasmic adaptor subunit [Candidatus Brocadiaceae bacterium]